eukprot:221891_1
MSTLMTIQIVDNLLQHFEKNDDSIKENNIFKSDKYWIRLQGSQLEHTFSSPILLNNNEIIVASQSIIDTEEDNDLYKPGIYKYNIKEEKASLLIAYCELTRYDGNRFTKMLDECASSGYSLTFSMAIDDIQNELYLMNEFGICLLINLISMENKYIFSTIETGLYPSLICINDELHIIGGDKNRKHLIFNVKTKLNVPYTVHEFKERKESFYAFSTCYIELKQLLFLFGGFDGDDDTYSIYIYSVGDKIWKISKTELSFNVCSQVVMLTPNEKNIIIFGTNGVIYIINVDNMNIFKTNITLPLSDIEANTEFTTVISNKYNYKTNYLLISGYIRKCINYEIPSQIEEIILKSYYLHYIYLYFIFSLTF